VNSVAWPILLPIVTALFCLLIGRASRWRRYFVACSAGVQVVFAALLTAQVIGREPLVMLVGNWTPPLGIVLVADGLAGIMLCLSATVALACILFSYAEIPLAAEQPLRLPLVQFIVAGINLTFVTGDLFNLFVAFEIMLIASYALLTLEANDRDIRQAFPYLAVNLFSSSLFLAGAGLAYAIFGTLNLAQISQRAAEMPGNPGVLLVAVLLTVVFGVKAGIFPLYYWLPNSYPILPFSLGALYSGMLTKVGVYVLLRMLCTVLPHTLDPLHALLAWLAGLTMIIAVLGAISRNFIRGILSYHILSQIGYMVLAIGFFTPLAIAGCIFYIIHHIIVKSSLFLIGGAAMFYNRTDNLARMGGLWKVSPWLGVAFLLQAFSLAGVPPLSGFWGKYIIVLVGLDQERFWLVAAAIVASVLTTMSMLKIWFGAFWQDVPENGALLEKAAPAQAMTVVICGMTALSLSIGFGAEYVMQLSQAAADTLLDQEQYRHAVFRHFGKGALP
jgi:multicomponent Na+:H+ antiporter subunit D